MLWGVYKMVDTGCKDFSKVWDIDAHREIEFGTVAELALLGRLASSRLPLDMVVCKNFYLRNGQNF